MTVLRNHDLVKGGNVSTLKIHVLLNLIGITVHKQVWFPDCVYPFGREDHAE